MRSLGILCLLLCMSLGACHQNSASAQAKSAAATAPTLCGPGKTGPGCTPQTPAVSRIVFVGKEHACDCTRKTVESGWATLQKVLGTTPKLPVERFQIDTQREKVAPFGEQKPIMALPAIYFVDAGNKVLDLLQGEVTEAQITAAMKR